MSNLPDALVNISNCKLSLGEKNYDFEAELVMNGMILDSEKEGKSVKIKSGTEGKIINYKEFDTKVKGLTSVNISFVLNSKKSASNVKKYEKSQDVRTGPRGMTFSLEFGEIGTVSCTVHAETEQQREERLKREWLIENSNKLSTEESEYRNKMFEYEKEYRGKLEQYAKEELERATAATAANKKPSSSPTASSPTSSPTSQQRRPASPSYLSNRSSDYNNDNSNATSPHTTRRAGSPTTATSSTNNNTHSNYSGALSPPRHQQHRNPFHQLERYDEDSCRDVIERDERAAFQLIKTAAYTERRRLETLSPRLRQKAAPLSPSQIVEQQETQLRDRLLFDERGDFGQLKSKTSGIIRRQEIRDRDNDYNGIGYHNSYMSPSGSSKGGGSPNTRLLKPDYYLGSRVTQEIERRQLAIEEQEQYEAEQRQKREEQREQQRIEEQFMKNPIMIGGMMLSPGRPLGPRTSSPPTAATTTRTTTTGTRTTSSSRSPPRATLLASSSSSSMSPSYNNNNNVARAASSSPNSASRRRQQQLEQIRNVESDRRRRNQQQQQQQQGMTTTGFTGVYYSNPKDHIVSPLLDEEKQGVDEFDYQGDNNNVSSYHSTSSPDRYETSSPALRSRITQNKYSNNSNNNNNLKQTVQYHQNPQQHRLPYPNMPGASIWERLVNRCKFRPRLSEKEIVNLEWDTLKELSCDLGFNSQADLSDIHDRWWSFKSASTSASSPSSSSSYHQGPREKSGRSNSNSASPGSRASRNVPNNNNSGGTIVYNYQPPESDGSPGHSSLLIPLPTAPSATSNSIRASGSGSGGGEMQLNERNRQLWGSPSGYHIPEEQKVKLNQLLSGGTPQRGNFGNNNNNNNNFNYDDEVEALSYNAAIGAEAAADAYSNFEIHYDDKNGSGYASLSPGSGSSSQQGSQRRTKRF